MNKKITPNRYKPEPKEPSRRYEDLGAGIDICLKFIMVVALFSILSLAALFVHDFITQAELFNITEIEISGTSRATKEEILTLCDLNQDRNIFAFNTFLAQKQIESHPWIASASVGRLLHSKLKISITDQKPLAIVLMDNTAGILINDKGRPFKEYNPACDLLLNLPIITGLSLVQMRDEYLFAGILFDSVMDFLKTGEDLHVRHIDGNENTGITIQIKRFTNPISALDQGTIPVKLGFDNFKAKLTKAKKISAYFDKNLPERTINAMDLFNIEKVFIKTKLNDALHNNIKKGA